MPRVLNRSKHEIPKGAVYIGRPSKYGNPYVIGRDGTRQEVIDKYKAWLQNNPEIVEEFKRDLEGKDLVCHCKPKACHGDVLLDLVNNPLGL